MSSPHFSAVQRILADILEVSTQRITPESSPDTLEQWDSIRHMNFVLAIEGEFNVEFTVEEIESIGDVPRILALLSAKVG